MKEVIKDEIMWIKAAEWWWRCGDNKDWRNHDHADIHYRSTHTL